MAAPDAAGDDLKTAIVRTASAFDELVGEDAGRARGALAILASKAEGTTWTQVVDALRARCDDDGTVAAAIAAGAPLTMAAAEAEEQVA